MNLSMQSSGNSSGLRHTSWKLAIHGRIVDDRGKAAVDFARQHTSTLVSLDYEPDDLTITADNQVIAVDNLPTFMSALDCSQVLLETTTLGFVETLLCCRALAANQVTSFEILYVEPDQYSRPRQQHLLHRRDFELSADVPGYRGIPGHAILLSGRVTHKGVFFLGYEESRLRRAFEDLQMLKGSHVSVVFGVPAFKAGWEMDSIANNIDVIREENIRGGLYFCAANNPEQVIELLTWIQNGLALRERLFVAPIGTKPHGIGTALFAATNPTVRILYDHPRRTVGRSDDIGQWHLFSVAAFGT